MEQLTLTAYAKINLSLAITGQRQDGYHTLESVMQEISLGDTLEMERIPSGILLSCSAPHLPTDERNLCCKAAKAYLEHTGLTGGVRMRLIKAIPDGAGMGGGSADAAAVLKGMKLLYPSSADLFAIGAKLGADVPFCLMGKTALCQGIGERLTPLSFPCKSRWFCVVAKNCEGLSTPEIYSLYDRTEHNAPSRVKEFALALQKTDFPFALMQNDLELPALLQRPPIAALKEFLLHHGAEGAMMTGSGSAVFGLFSQESAARKAANLLQQEGIFSQFCTLL